jgi:hypothetical protein
MVELAGKWLLAMSLVSAPFLCQGQCRGQKITITWSGIAPPVQNKRGVQPAEVSDADLSVPKQGTEGDGERSKGMVQGRLTEAEEAFKNAILSYPSFSGAYNNLGVVFLHEARRADAEWAFRQALNINGRSTRALLNLANAVFGNRNYAEAAGG